MADLPEFRFPDVNKQYSFGNTRMDVFEPFCIEDKREGTQMHFVCLFGCLVNRAVQLKVCNDLSTDCLLMTIRRIVSQRGYFDLIVSEDGRNSIWSQPCKEVPERLQARQRVHRSAIGSSEHSVDFQPSIGTTLRRSLGEADTDREEESTNSAGQSETNILSFPASCDRGRVNLEFQPIKSCGLQHLR